LDGAWREVDRLSKSGAVIKSNRAKLSGVKRNKIMVKAGEELLELATASDEENEVEEIADLLVCLAHLCTVKKYTSRRIAEKMFEKMKKRIK